MRIKEAQERTGITIKNIRFYEKEGLLSAERNSQNHYRIYDESDIQRLMQIRLFRKLGLSIRLMKLLFDGEIDLATCLELRSQEIREEQERLRDMEELCQKMQHDKAALPDLDVVGYLTEIENSERRGAHFMNEVWDYVTRAANILPTPEYWFEPEEPILKKEEFTKELLIWSEKKGKRMELLHEGMEPVVLLDGKRYVGMLEYPRYLELPGILRLLPFFSARAYGFKFAYLYPFQ